MRALKDLGCFLQAVGNAVVDVGGVSSRSALLRKKKWAMPKVKMGPHP